jgi:DNA polymerase (family 10)
MPVQNAEIAAMFDQAAEFLDIEGENPFRVRAYRRAARVIDSLPQSVAGLLSTGRDLSELPGISKDLAHKIADIVESGHFDLLDSLKKKLPGQLGEIAALPSLGPKRVKLLHDQLKVSTLADLRRVIAAGRLREIRGFGPKIEKKIFAALKKPSGEKRFKLRVAEAEADALVAFLRNGKHVVVAGSYRRRRDTVGDLDVLVTAQDGTAVGKRLVRYENIGEVLAHGPTRTTVVLRSGLQVDVRVVPEPSYGAALLYFTGSKAHNIALRGLANERGWKLNEYGLFAGRRRIAGASEEEVYKKLGLTFIPPEMREDRGEIAALGLIPRAPKAHCASPGCDLIRRSNCPSVLAPSTTDAHYKPGRAGQGPPIAAPRGVVGYSRRSSCALGLDRRDGDHWRDGGRRAGARLCLYGPDRPQPARGHGARSRPSQAVTPNQGHRADQQDAQWLHHPQRYRGRHPEGWQP